MKNAPTHPKPYPGAFGTRGSKEQVQIGRFVCDRFTGEFTERSLQSKAETGLWYARAQGTGLGIEGEGDSPENAVRDMRKRAQQTRDELDQVYDLPFDWFKS